MRGLEEYKQKNKQCVCHARLHVLILASLQINHAGVLKK
jgi:hypothetical protein